jgi:CRP-like cAMP-binding protein
MSATSSPDLLRERIRFLKTVPVFASLGEAHLSSIAQSFRPRTYEKSDVIFRQGDNGHEVYLIREGKVRIFKVSPSGQETSIILLSTGALVGEYAVIDGRTRSATARALQRCEIWEMAGSRFLQCVREIPDFALALCQLLVAKARWNATYAEMIAQYDAAGRFLQILLLYNEQFGKVVQAGKSYELDLALTQDDLASLVGARREWVNRTLQEWRRRGLLDYQAGKIMILDLPGVQEERDRRFEAYQVELG